MVEHGRGILIPREAELLDDLPFLLPSRLPLLPVIDRGVTNEIEVGFISERRHRQGGDYVEVDSLPLIPFDCILDAPLQAEGGVS